MTESMDLPSSAKGVAGFAEGFWATSTTDKTSTANMAFTRAPGCSGVGIANGDDSRGEAGRQRELCLLLLAGPGQSRIEHSSGRPRHQPGGAHVHNKTFHGKGQESQIAWRRHLENLQVL